MKEYPLKELRRYLRRELINLTQLIGEIPPERQPKPREEKYSYLHAMKHIREAQYRDICLLLQGKEPLGGWPRW